MINFKIRYIQSPDQLPYAYYISVNKRIFDIQSAAILNLQKKQYQNYLIKLGGYTGDNSEVYFKTKEIAQNAIEWMESLVTLNTLEKNNG